MNKTRLPAFIVFVAALVCVVTNIYWLVHKNLNPKPFIIINATTGIFILIMIFTARYNGKHK